MITADFVTVLFSDGSLTVTVSPPTPIGGQLIRYREFVNFGGGDPLILVSGQTYSGNPNPPDNIVEKWLGSGTGANLSGMTILNSGIGIFRVNFPAGEASGRSYGAYPFEVERVDSGYVNMLARGYRHLI